MCRQGASVIQQEVLNTIQDPTLRVFIAWVPILPSDKHAPDNDTLSLAPDKRATHYWDEKGKLPRLFQKILSLTPRPAWDVYLIYPPGVTWEQEPPKPVYWQHQLGGVTAAPRLDGKSFAEELRKVLKEVP